MQNLKMCMDGNLVSRTNGKMRCRCENLTVWLKQDKNIGDGRKLKNEELQGL